MRQDTSNHEAAEQFWQEITAQSWRMDLDYGLNKDATLQAAAEPLLVVLSNRQALQQLVAAAVQQTTGNCGFESEGLCMVQVDGWNQGEQQQQLESWRQLQPRPVPLPAAQDAAL